MALQVLQGIRITPKGSYNLSRFANSFQGTSWPNSYAFGGWIYNASCDVGFNDAPTEIKISVVLEAGQRPQMAATFNITQQDLKVDAGAGNDENLYDIDFNGIVYTDFVLYNYEIIIEAGSKVLNATFRDYSIILDKIYVGLLKRQGNKYIHTSVSQLQFPVNCPDCLLNGSSFIQIGNSSRDISYGSYAGVNGKVYDNFEGIAPVGNIYNRWSQLFSQAPSSTRFDLNGGYVILGTEEITEEKCGDLGGISYSFNQLLASLRLRGLQFTGAFPQAINEADFAYKQNYIGTLREVLQQWCADLGYDFYCQGRQFVGLNVTRALDISKIQDVADPATELGSNFSLQSNTAILSYRESNSIANSYKQSVITANTTPRQTKTHTKAPKRYVGYLPLHPIDFNSPSRQLIQRFDLFGNVYTDFAWANSFEPGSNDLSNTLYQLDNRTFYDVDTAIALSHFDSDLRDIYCQQAALNGANAEIRASNFRALGMVPLIEITGAYDKSAAIESVFNSSSDETSNVCLDARYYRVFIGYYYPKYKEDIVAWEQASAEAMYKFGALTKGLVQRLPYVPSDVLTDLSPAAGLYGSNGTSFLRVTHSYEPSTKQYFDLYNAPFKDLILYSGLKNRGNYFPELLNIAELSNDWGTTHEQFQHDLSLQLDDACVNDYASSPSYTQIQNNVKKTYQDWKLANFKPQITSDLEKFFFQYLPQLKKLDASLTDLDRHVQRYYDLNYQETNTCSKLNIFVLTDTLTHPNITVNFNRRGREFVNPVVLQKYRQQQQDALKRKAYTKTPNLCEKTLLQEMCEGLILTSGTQYTADPRWSCAPNQDVSDAYEEGFDAAYLSSPNSRGLDIKIVKNPIRNNDTDALQAIYRGSDINGSFYYTDTIVGFNDFQQKQANLTIVYPISADAADNVHYKGILSSSVEVENRSPEIVEIFGEPSNDIANTTAGIRVINNVVDPDLQPQLDPLTSRFVSYLTVITGNNQVITSVSGYHDFIKNLNTYQITGATKAIDLSLAGTPDMFGTFRTYLSPSYGMNKMSVSVTDNGVVTSLSYADRPPQLPKQEAILNKIGPRIK
jgi:hypothetical protein